jgi:hypothetical protein
MMMPVSNRFNLPDVVVKALTVDTYSRGNSDISITTLIDSPRIGILQKEHENEIEQDAVDFLWSRFGTSVHNMFENAAEGDETCISEERLYHPIQGWTVSGAIDLQHVELDGVIISDYKVTSVWSVIYDKVEWHRQLNCYAWLVRHGKQMPVKQLRIIAILRDWQRRKAEEGGNYPESPIMIVDIPLWSDSEQDEYVDTRVRMHQSAHGGWAFDDELPNCSDSERWVKPTTYAVKKKSRVRAIKIHDSYESAEEHAIEMGKEHFVEERKGSATRCEQNWCRVAQWCDQYQGEINA